MKYALHIHTNRSLCSSNNPKDVLSYAKKAGLNGIAITDHNTISGAIETHALNTDKNFEVIIGEEVSTDIGHVLILYVKKEIRPGKIEEVLKEAKKQNAISILAHPYNLIQEKFFKNLGGKNGRKSIKPENIHKVKMFDAIEGFNARCFLKKDNEMAQILAKKYGKPMVSGSDAHFPNEICNTFVEFDRKYTLRQAIKQNRIKFYGKKRYILVNKFRSSLKVYAGKNKKEYKIGAD